MNLRTNGHAHLILQTLEGGELEVSAILARLQGKLTDDTLDETNDKVRGMDGLGLVLITSDKVSITAAGQAELNKLNAKAEELLRTAKVKANLVSPPSGTYTCPELARTAIRPGSMDYRKFPSIINGSRVMPK